jgi:hypothetical protein
MTAAVSEYPAARRRAMKVHPVTDLLPMMTDDEIADLAEDIKTQGLLNPIVLDDQGMLIDGRNRLRACELAGVEPRFEQLNGYDPVAFIFGQNAKRRHVSKRQIAVAAAKAMHLNSTRPLPRDVERSTGAAKRRTREEVRTPRP